MGSNLTSGGTILHNETQMIRNRPKNRFLSSLIALAIFASGLVTAFHHHAEEAMAADHCAVCIVGQQARSGEAPCHRDLGLGLAGAVVSVLVPDSPFFAFSHIRLGKFSQAPPFA